MKEQNLVLMDYEKGIYAFFDEQGVYKGELKEGKLTKTVRVLSGYPKEVKVLYDGTDVKYKMTWMKPDGKANEIGFTTLDNLYKRLKDEGLVLCERHAEDVLAVLIQFMVKNGKAEVFLREPELKMDINEMLKSGQK